jgi:hypothetical protein
MAFVFRHGFLTIFRRRTWSYDRFNLKSCPNMTGCNNSAQVWSKPAVHDDVWKGEARIVENAQASQFPDVSTTQEPLLITE